MNDDYDIMKKMGEALIIASDPNKSEEEKCEAFFESIFGKEEYEDVKMHQIYDFHTASLGLFNGKVLTMKICGLFDGAIFVPQCGLHAQWQIFHQAFCEVFC